MIRKYTKVKCISCGTVIERLHLHKGEHKCIKCQERINREKANERNRALTDLKVGFVASKHDGYFEPKI